MMTALVSEIVPDPVSHISISGVHGQEEVIEHIANAAPQPATNGRGRSRASSVGTLLLGAALGAGLMYLFDRATRKTP
jgi:hypothetical protein